MKKQILLSTLSFILIVGKTVSQTYSPIAATGYTLDAVAENTTALSTTSGPLDGSNYVLYSAAYGALYSIVGGIPNNGVITSGSYSFQLQPYTQNNVLFMLTGQSDTLTFTSPTQYGSLSLLGFATEGAGSMNAIVRFTDNSTQVFNNLTLPDWFTGGSFITSGFGRAGRSSGTITNPAGQPYMYNTNLNLTCANRTKNVAKIIIQNNSANARIAIMAVSGSAIPNYTTSSIQTGCIGGANGSASVIAVNGLPPLTYTWSTNPMQNTAQATNLTAGVYSYTVRDVANCAYTSTVSVASATNPPLQVVAISSSSVVCSGSTATLSGGGASTYTWTPGNISGATIVVNPISQTIYTVVGSNTLCSGVFTISINTNPNPTITTSSSSSVICSGSTATLTASGASSYTWQAGGPVTGSLITVSPTAPVSYPVSGTNSFGCVTNTSQVIIVNPSPNISTLNSNSLICLGASATLIASGGNNYSWDFGSNSPTVIVSPSVTTIYSVTSTNTTTGCSNTQTVSVSVFTQTIAVSSSTAICLGNSVTLNASGGTTYLWNTGSTSSSIFVSPTSSTIYTVSAITATNSMNCSSSGSVGVTVNANPTVTAVLSKTLICKGESAVITASGASTYTWNTNATTQTLSISPTTNTTYTVSGTDLNGCVNTTTILAKSSTCVGIINTSETQNLGLKLYPNPNNGSFTIKSDMEISLNLVNELGQVIRKINLSEQTTFEANISDLSNGIYFLIGTNNHANVNQKIIVRQ